jgi:UDP-2-acetamido-3-amino-2,3-dideoxy-glucuronate N-acetyltransferase
MADNKFIGLIGLGYWGKNILRNLFELEVLRVVCDNREEAIEEVKRGYPDLKYVRDYKELIEDDEIKAVAIATPAATHYKIVKEVLVSGKDVFVEKPLAMTVKEGEELAEIAKEKGCVLMVGHLLHYHPAVIKLKELIKIGKLGKVQYIYSNRLNIGKLRTEENILWSFAPHDISVILKLLDEEPIKVYAYGGDYLNAGVYDTTLSILEFQNGVRGHIFVSWLHPFKEQKLIVVGTQAMVVFDDLTEEKLFYYPHVIEWVDGKVPVAHKAKCMLVRVNKEEPLKMEMMHFVECVRNRKRPETDVNEALRVLRVLEACQNFINEQRSGGINERGKGGSLAGMTKGYYVHESSYIDEGVEIGEGSKIWHFCHIMRNSKIGKNCVIGQNVMIGSNVKIGNKVKIQNNVSVYEGVEIEDEVFCGPSMVFTNVINPRAFIERKHEFRTTLVKRGATLGANSTIMCGITIGEYAFIGAGALVNKDVLPYALMVGVPAKQIGWVCECGNTLKGVFVDGKIMCRFCGLGYVLEGEMLRKLKEEEKR